MIKFETHLKEAIEEDLYEGLSPSKMKIAALKVVRDNEAIFKGLELGKFVSTLKKKMKGLDHKVAEQVYGIAIG